MVPPEASHPSRWLSLRLKNAGCSRAYDNYVGLASGNDADASQQRANAPAIRSVAECSRIWKERSGPVLGAVSRSAAAAPIFSAFREAFVRSSREPVIAGLAAWSVPGPESAALGEGVRPLTPATACPWSGSLKEDYRWGFSLLRLSMMSRRGSPVMVALTKETQAGAGLFNLKTGEVESRRSVSLLPTRMKYALNVARLGRRLEVPAGMEPVGAERHRLHNPRGEGERAGANESIEAMVHVRSRESHAQSIIRSRPRRAWRRKGPPT